MEARNHLREAATLIRKAGLRVTHPRLLVVHVLAETDGHLTAEQIHTRLNTGGKRIDLATVHRTLTLLSSLELIHQVRAARALVFGHARRPHAHAICRSCDSTSDVPQADTGIQGPDGFSVESVILHGACGRCTGVGPERPKIQGR